MDDVEDSKMANYLVMHLSGMAYDVWKGMKDSDKRSVNEIKEVLHVTYGIQKPVAWQAMTTYRIRIGQQLDSACEELYKWAKIVTAGENPASTLAIVAFMEALPVHIAQKVQVLCGQSATKEQVVTAAKDIWDEAEFEVAAVANQFVQQKDAYAEGCLVISNYRAALSSKHVKENRRCYGCGIAGHLRNACAAVSAKCDGRRHTELFCRKAGNKAGEQ